MSQIPKSYDVTIAGLTRTLRVCQVAPRVHIGILKLSGDAKLTEAVGIELANLVPMDVEVLVMPDGKAQALLHVVERETGLPSVLARKEAKVYMPQPVLATPAESITTPGKHLFHLDADDVAKVRGRKVAILDDVVSFGGTIKAMRALLAEAGVRETVLMAVGTEGDRRSDVLCLTHFPVFIEV